MTEQHFYINGNRVGVEYAKARFAAFSQRVLGVDGDDMEANWEACLKSEEARDAYFPDNLEMTEYETI